MNYISEIRAFYDWLQFNPISSGAQALWYALMHLNNKCAVKSGDEWVWKDHFTVPNSTLLAILQISKSQLDRMRSVLVQTGRISYEKGKDNQCGTYSIVAFDHDFVQILGSVCSNSGIGSDQILGTLGNSNGTGNFNPNGNGGGGESLRDSPQDRNPTISIPEVVELFARCCPNLLPPTTKETDRQIQALLSSCTAEQIKRGFELANSSDYICGRVKGKDWVSDFGWIVKPKTFAKILQGAYNNSPKGNSGSQPASYDIEELDRYWDDTPKLELKGSRKA